MVESGSHESAADVSCAGTHAGERKFRGHASRSVKSAERRWWHGLAVHGVFWRKFVDWGVRNLPAVLHPPLIWLGSSLFFLIAAPARRSLARNLSAIFEGSSALVNYLRVLRVFANFGWSLSDAAVYRLCKPPFHYELDGEDFLRQLTSGGGAIALTAHMGNYDLGAALFAQKFERNIRMVRAPEPDLLAAAHVDLSLQQSGAGAVKIGYSNAGSALAFDLFSALRNGEIISIQGDRVVGEVARVPVHFFGREVWFPNGPFVLAFVSEAPIYPLFIVRAGYRKYKIIAREPITCSRNNASRDQIIAKAMERWSRLLEGVVRDHWQQWFAFKPLL